jgi:hypothetical protein
MRSNMYPEPISVLELFEPAPEIISSIEEVARLAHVPRRLIAVYFRYGLVSAPVPWAGANLVATAERRTARSRPIAAGV